MRTLLADHPLVTHKLTLLRDAATDTATFRILTDELVTLLAYEATREIRAVTGPRSPRRSASPLAPACADPKPLIVPVLRAGIGMLDGMTRLLPMASVGFVGMVRDEESLVASTYANRLPARLDGREVFVLDPMLATGGTLVTVVSMLLDRGAAAVTAVCLLAAPEGMATRGGGLPRRQRAGGHGRGRRPAQRQGLHRARPRRRRRPSLRRDLRAVNRTGAW